VKRRALVIGREGQIARALARHLPSSGLEVTALARPDIDLAQPASMLAAIRKLRPDIIINPAAYTAVDRAEAEPDLAFAINRDGASALARAAASIGAPFIHFSTDYVFDGGKPTPYTEDDPTGPLNVYGASKLAGEEAVREAWPRHLLLRTSWVCGPDGANFVRTMLRLAAARQGEPDAALRVVADQRGAPSFCDDIARAIAALIPALGPDAPDAHFGTFHIASSGETNWAGFAEAIMASAAARGAPSLPVQHITTAEYPTPACRPMNSRLDCGKLKRIHGIELPHWREGLEECLDALIGPDSGPALNGRA
jgi:dTDP-4-dehydrorhamnose reductase